MSREPVLEAVKIEIIEKYQTGKYTCSKLAREYNCCVATVCKLLKNNKIVLIDRSISHRRYSLNQNYFDIIDTEGKAYFLGLLYADGCSHSNRPVVSITLQEEDKHILDEFNLELESNSPIRFFDRKMPNRKNIYTLAINNKRISAELKRLGCVPKKSLILEFPTEEQVPSHLIRHFIRGYFDGDGCTSIHHNKNNSIGIRVDLVSTENFCISLNKILKSELNIDGKIYQCNDRGTSTRKLDMRNIEYSVKFLSWIYKDSTFFLKRKHNKYQEYLSNLEYLEKNFLTTMSTRADFQNLLTEPNSKFNNLTVIDFYGKEYKSTRYVYMWICRCDCGNLTKAQTSDLTTDKKKSCGCLRGQPNIIELPNLE